MRRYRIRFTWIMDLLEILNDFLSRSTKCNGIWIISEIIPIYTLDYFSGFHPGLSFSKNGNVLLYYFSDIDIFYNNNQFQKDKIITMNCLIYEFANIVHIIKSGEILVKIKYIS